MSDDGSEFLDKLSQAIVDGDSIDWGEIEKLRLDENVRRQVEQLRVLFEIGRLHRSPDEPHLLDSQAGTIPPARPLTGNGPGGPEGPPVPRAPGHPGDPGEERRGIGRWGHLVLLRKIGSGGFGDVYHAHDSWLDRSVALKLLKSGSGLPEARKLALVRHPNVVMIHGADEHVLSLYGVDEHEARVGFWMDLVEGDTLSDLVAGGRLSAGEVRYIGQEVCRALTAVHLAKLVHRDVKAKNVMRASDGGRIVLIDFGLGEFMDDRVEKSNPGGTLHYIAPEIFAGGVATVQTDIYAVGVLLFYLVTASFPVQGSSIEAVAGAHKRGDRQHLRELCPDVPDSFVAIVERALDPDPARRYASAGKMLAALAGDDPNLIPNPDVLTPFQKAVRVGLVLLSAAVATEVSGLFTCRVFEAALKIDPEFRAGVTEYFSFGTYALFPFVFVWSGCAAILGVLAGLRPLFRSSVQSLARRWKPRFTFLDPGVMAALLFLIGAGCFVLVTAAFWRIYVGIEVLAENPRASAADLWMISPAAHDIHVAYGICSAGLSFALALAAWLWFPRVERQVEDGSTVRIIKWGTVALAVLVVAMVVAQWRVLWDKFEVVTFDDRPALVIGSNSDELLLYAPYAAERPRWRVRKDATSLKRTGHAVRELFDSQWP